MRKKLSEQEPNLLNSTSRNAWNFYIFLLYKGISKDQNPVTNSGSLGVLKGLRSLLSAGIHRTKPWWTSCKDLTLYLENLAFDIKNFTKKKKKVTTKKPTTYLSSLVLPNQLNCTGVRPSMHTVSKKNGRKRALEQSNFNCIMWFNYLAVSASSSMYKWILINHVNIIRLFLFAICHQQMDSLQAPIASSKHLILSVPRVWVRIAVMTLATMEKILKLQETSDPRVGTLGAGVTPSIKRVHMLWEEWDLPQHLEVTFTGQRCGQSRDQHHVLVGEVRKEEARINVDIIETGWDLEPFAMPAPGKVTPLATKYKETPWD